MVHYKDHFIYLSAYMNFCVYLISVAYFNQIWDTTHYVRVTILILFYFTDLNYLAYRFPVKFDEI
jgi:hypothetical protein